MVEWVTRTGALPARLHPRRAAGVAPRLVGYAKRTARLYTPRRLGRARPAGRHHPVRQRVHPHEARERALTSRDATQRTGWSPSPRQGAPPTNAHAVRDRTRQPPVVPVRRVHTAQGRTACLDVGSAAGPLWVCPG